MRFWRLLPGSLTGLGAALVSLVATEALADQFHYNNVLIGTRAVGMGGAFGGVADDASGVYYNPAGLAFALSNDIQGSANAFYKKQTTYKETLGDEDFVEESSGSLTPFFGGLQKLDRYVEGLVFAFGVYNIDGDLKDQDTTIEGMTIGSTVIDRYHRTSNARASTYYAGAAVGYRPMPSVAIGFGLNYYNADELVQEFQYAKQTVKAGENTYWRILDSNVREHLTVYGFQPVLGVQVALPAGLAVGLTLKQGMIASQNYDSTAETNTQLLTSDQLSEIQKPGGQASSVGSDAIASSKSQKPVGSLPMETRLGLAWFTSPTLLWAMDFTYYSATKNAAELESNGNRPKYNREAVLNWATGVEWYVIPAFPLRFGLFSNNDSRPKIKQDSSNKGKCNIDKDYTEKYCGQPDHVDYVGESLFISWVQPNSQISAGVVLQQGKGEAQKLGNDQTQKVTASSFSFAFSATHNL